MENDASLAMSCRGEPGGSVLHLSEGNRRVFAFPVYPDYSLCQSRNGKLIKCGQGAASQKFKVFKQSYLIIAVGAIKTIEVGLVAVLVPPASNVSLGTVDPQRSRVLVSG